MKCLADVCVLSRSVIETSKPAYVVVIPSSLTLRTRRENISGDQLKVDVADILSYNDELASYVEENPSESLPLVRFVLE
jgi:DNA replicative helicase MCM subunit Mcm2 (Cdc46/Mcm family)